MPTIETLVIGATDDQFLKLIRQFAPDLVFMDNVQTLAEARECFNERMTGGITRVVIVCSEFLYGNPKTGIAREFTGQFLQEIRNNGFKGVIIPHIEDNETIRQLVVYDGADDPEEFGLSTLREIISVVYDRFNNE